jgi:hypothetical protein
VAAVAAKLAAKIATGFMDLSCERTGLPSMGRDDRSPLTQSLVSRPARQVHARSEKGIRRRAFQWGWPGRVSAGAGAAKLPPAAVK